MAEKKKEIDKIRKKIKQIAEKGLEFDNDNMMAQQAPMDSERFQEIKERAEKGLTLELEDTDEDDKIKQTRKKIDRLRKRL